MGVAVESGPGTQFRRMRAGVRAGPLLKPCSDLTYDQSLVVRLTNTRRAENVNQEEAGYVLRMLSCLEVRLKVEYNALSQLSVARGGDRTEEDILVQYGQQSFLQRLKTRFWD